MSLIGSRVPWGLFSQLVCFVSSCPHQGTLYLRSSFIMSVSWTTQTDQVQLVTFEPVKFHIFFSDLLYNKKAEESITSLIGVAVGGGLFLTVLMVGVMIWITREREEDEEVMEEAQKLQGSRRRRNLVSFSDDQQRAPAKTRDSRKIFTFNVRK